MNKSLVSGIIVAVVFAGAGFWGGMTYAQSKTTSARSAFTGGGNFAGRGAGGAGGRFAGGATFGTIIAMDPTSITIQMPTSTSTTATTGTKIVLYDSSTQVQELQTVSATNLKVGQMVMVAGTANSDGSVTASMIQVRPGGAGRPGGAPSGQ